MWKFIVWGSRLVGFILTIIGLAGVPEDLAMWEHWISNGLGDAVNWEFDFAGNEGRWIFTISGFLILFVAYRVPQLIWEKISLGKGDKLDIPTIIQSPPSRL